MCKSRYFFSLGKIKIVGISITMSLVRNSYASTTSDLRLEVEAGTSGQVDFTVKVVDNTALLTAADAAIADYDGISAFNDGTLRPAAATAATAAGLFALAAAITDAADDAAAKVVLDAAITGTGAIGAAITADSDTAFTSADLVNGNYRIAYSDAIGAVNYQAANSVFAIQLSIVNGKYVGSHGKLSNVKTNAIYAADGVTITTQPSEITGTMIGLINGTGYGMQITQVKTAGSGASASVGAGASVPRVIVNGGPTALTDGFRVNLSLPSAGTNGTDEDDAVIELNLAASQAAAEHTTGDYKDIKYVRFMWSNAITCEFKTIDFDIQGSSTIYDGGSKLLVNRLHDFESPVATTLFEYSVALVDSAGVVSSYASTEYSSSVADNATGVQNISISGDTASGTELVIEWDAPEFTAKTILGYQIIVQKLATGTAALADISKASNGVTPFICDYAHANNLSQKIELGAVSFKTDSTTRRTYTYTGLTPLAKYAVWVRAYHPVVTGMPEYGAIGMDKMSTPTQKWVADSDGASTAGYVAWAPTKDSWAGSYIETAANATPLNATELGTPVRLFDKLDSSQLDGVSADLTGAPADFSSVAASIVVLNGNAVQKGGVDADAGNNVADIDGIMDSSIAIKWRDEDLNFRGMEDSGREMQYMCFEKSVYDNATTNGYLTDYYAGVLETTSSTTAIPNYYAAGWTMMVNDSGAIGDGVTTNPAYQVFAKDSSTRYCRFSNTATVANGALTTFNADGSVNADAVPTLRRPVLTSFTEDDDDLLTGVTAAAATLELGSEYVFVLRLKNSNGTNTPKPLIAKMVQGRAKASAFFDEDGEVALSSDASDDTTKTSLLWNPASSRFEFKICDKDKTDEDDIATLHEATGAKPTDMSYDVQITAFEQGDSRNGANAYGSDKATQATHEVILNKSIACTAGAPVDGVTTVSFDKVYAKELTHVAAVTGGANASTTSGSEALVSLSDLYGYTFKMKLIAKNSNGSAHNGEVTYDTARQVFSTEATFAGLLTQATIVKPADTVVSGVTTVYADVREQTVANYSPTNGGPADSSNIILNLSADIKDITAANFDTVGRKVDKIRYEIYQTKSDGTKETLQSVTDVTPTYRITPAVGQGSEGTSGRSSEGLSMSYSQVIYTTTTDATVDIANEMTNRFNVHVPKSLCLMGYPIKMKISLVSDAAADLAQTPAGDDLAASSKEFVMTEKLVTFTTKPVENHDEAGHMSVIAGDNQLTVSWSAPNMAADELQGVGENPTAPTLEGYQLELYDIITRTRADNAAVKFKVVTGITAAEATDALSVPSHKITKSTLLANMTQYTITGLKNGKNYVPVLKTVTRQGGVDVISEGRTTYGTIGTDSNEVVFHAVDVMNDDDSVAYTAARWRTTSNQTDKTGEVLKTTAGSSSKTSITPFGAPIITADLTADANSLKVDDNGSGLLFGAMLQTAPGGTNATPSGGSQRIGSEANAAPGIDNVFYLDLSFGGAGVGVTPFDSGPVPYKSPAGQSDAGTTYPGRMVTSVASEYLGANWTQESNYLFASNEAGTTVGKIVGGAYTAL